MDAFGTKARTSLMNIKKACDAITISRGELNYSGVGKFCEREYGTPKTQSILNNKDLKRYIGARIFEYSQGRKFPNLPLADCRTKSAAYPSDDLDPKTKVYIDQLRSRIKLLENINKELSKNVENLTKASPVNLAQAIGFGADYDGAMQIEFQREKDSTLEMLREAMTKVLELKDYPASNLVIKENGDRRMMLLERPSGDHIVLEPEHFFALDRLFEDN